jgi:hypothetical protein
MVDYNIAIPQQQLFQAPDMMQNAMRMQQMQTQGASAESANQLRAMQTRGLEQGQQLTAIQIQAAKQNMATAAAAARAQATARAEALGDRNALLGAIRGSVVGDAGPLPGPDLRLAANRLAAEGKLNPAATALGAAETFTKADKANADLSKVNIENLDKQTQVYRTFASSVRSPEDAGTYVAAMFDDPLIGPFIRRMGTREELIAKGQKDFAELGQAGWYAANSNLNAEQVMGTRTKKYVPTDLGGEVSTQAYLLGEPVGEPTRLAKTMTPQQEANFETPEQKLDYQRKLKTMEAQVAAEAPPRALTAQQENKLRADVGKDRKAAITTIDAMGDMLDAVRGVRELSPGQKDSITGVRSYAFPLTQSSKTAETKLENLKGKVISLGKQIASVGGAIGSIATQEWQILSSQVASLKTEKMSGKDLDDQLDIIQGMANRLINRVRDSYTTQYEDLNAKYNGRFSLDYDRPSAGAGAGAGAGVNGVDTSNPLLR